MNLKLHPGKKTMQRGEIEILSEDKTVQKKRKIGNKKRKKDWKGGFCAPNISFIITNNQLPSDIFPTLVQSP